MITGGMWKKYTSPLTAITGIEILGVLGMMLGVLPREAALFLLGIFVFFVIFAPLKQAVLFAVFSIPIYTALPISNSFDSMAAWRIIIAILFLRTLAMNWKTILCPQLGRISVFVCSLFALGIISLLVAQEPIFGIRKLLYLANIIALFFVVRGVIKNRDDFIDVLKYTFSGVALMLAIGYAQFITILFIPLYTFWQWWASHVIPVFYGNNLGELLSFSNTWFSYYENAEPTLRIFSLFPDSHSFALSMILTLPMALTFFVLHKNKKGSLLFFGGVSALILLAIIFSGTRGAWVGAMPTFVVAGAFLVFNRIFGVVRLDFDKLLIVKICVASFLVLAILFPVSSQILKFSQFRQGGIVSGTTFERISTSFSMRELSNKGRIQIWRSTLVSIVEKPFLGVGMGNYPIVLNENISATKEGASAHSLYLDVVSEMGVVGGILLLLIFLEILRRAIKVFFKNEWGVLSIFAGFFAIYFLWVMAYSVVDVVLLNDKVLLLFTTLVALLYAGINQHSRV